MYQERIGRVLAAMEQMGLEQMIVSDPDSIWYLTGYYVFPLERLFALYLRRDGKQQREYCDALKILFSSHPV